MVILSGSGLMVPLHLCTLMLRVFGGGHKCRVGRGPYGSREICRYWQW